ncbi:MAG: transglutaminase family protein [Thermofilum sp.]
MSWRGRSLALLALALWLMAPLSSRTFVIRIQYIAYGSGVVDSSVYSKHMILVPTLEGVQERVTAELYVNGVPASYSVMVDPEGNEYADPGPLSFSGSLNLTLVQKVRTLSPPFRAKFELPAGVSWEEARGRLPRNSFWRCNSSRVKFEEVERISWELRSRAETPAHYLLSVIQWILERFKYSESTVGGVRCPSSFLENLTGPCGDVHAFAAALLKIQGLDAALVYAYIVDPSASQELSSQGLRYSLVGAHPHIFSVVNFSSRIVPVDLTASAGESARDKISGSSLNVLDNIIVLYRIRESNPNDYLIVYGVEGATQVWLRIDVSELQDSSLTRAVLLASGALALLLLVRLSPSTSRVEK